MATIILRGGEAFIDGRLVRADILIKDRRIAKTGATPAFMAQIIDCTGK